MDIEKLMQTYPNLTDVHATQDEPLMIRAGGALKKLRETAGKDFFTALFTSYVNEDRMTAYKKKARSILPFPGKYPLPPPYLQERRETGRRDPRPARALRTPCRPRQGFLGQTLCP